MFFASDNTGPVHPRIMAALSAANSGYAPAYGQDGLTEEVTARLRACFEAPDAAVHLLATGTAANSLALATLGQPWQQVFCAPLAHINTDECNAPEFFSGGARLFPVGTSDKLDPATLAAAIDNTIEGDVHVAQRGPVALTQATEAGRIYSLDEIRALSKVAHDFGLPLFMDGARFANAAVALGCTPAEMSWRAGVDALSFGGTKNGCMGVEAVLFFDPAMAWEFELRRKRSAHLFSKHRYLSAQMRAYLDDDLWHDMAGAANAACARLAKGLRALPHARLEVEPEANIIFASLPRSAHRRLLAAGAQYGFRRGYRDEGDADEMLSVRLVCDWSISAEQIKRFLSLAAE